MEFLLLHQGIHFTLSWSLINYKSTHIKKKIDLTILTKYINPIDFELDISPLLYDNIPNFLNL